MASIPDSSSDSIHRLSPLRAPRRSPRYFPDTSDLDLLSSQTSQDYLFTGHTNNRQGTAWETSKPSIRKISSPVKSPRSEDGKPKHRRMVSAPPNKHPIRQSLGSKVYQIKISMLCDRGQNINGIDYPDVIRTSDSFSDQNSEIPIKRVSNNKYEVLESINGARLRIVKSSNKLNFEFIVGGEKYSFPFPAVESEDADLYGVPKELRGLFTGVFQAGSDKDIRTLVLSYREFLKPVEFVDILSNIYHYSSQKTKKIVGRVVSYWLKCWKFRDQLSKKQWKQIDQSAPFWFQKLDLKNRLEARDLFVRYSVSEAEDLKNDIKKKFNLTAKNIIEARNFFEVAEYLGFTDFSGNVKLPWKGAVVKQHLTENGEGIKKLQTLIAEFRKSLYSESDLFSDCVIKAEPVKWPIGASTCERHLGLLTKENYKKPMFVLPKDWISINQISETIHHSDLCNSPWWEKEAHSRTTFINSSGFSATQPPGDHSKNKSRFSSIWGTQSVSNNKSRFSSTHISRALSENLTSEQETTKQFDIVQRNHEIQLDTVKKIQQIISDNFSNLNMRAIREQLGDQFNLDTDGIDQVLDVFLDQEDKLRLFSECWTPAQIAMALTYIDYTHLSQIHIGEIFNENFKEKHFPMSPNWRKWGTYSKNLCTWVTYQVITSISQQGTAQKISCLARIADICLTIRNWNAAFFILANLKPFQSDEYRVVWTQLDVRTLSILNKLEEAFNNIYGERGRKRLGSDKSAPVSRTLRDLKDIHTVAVVPIFYLLNRYATLSERLPKKTKDGQVNTERYEEEWKFYQDNIGRHQEREVWESQLKSTFPANSMTVCKALACRLEKEILKCKEYGYTERKDSPYMTKLLEAEENFKKRVLPATKCVHFNQNYSRATWILLALFSHYMILFHWSFQSHIQQFWVLAGLSIIGLSGLIHIWFLLRVERNDNISHLSVEDLVLNHNEWDIEFMNRVSSSSFWFEAVLSVFGLSILTVTWRGRNHSYQREDWWADGYGEMFEFSRCVAIYTFVEFFMIVSTTVYKLENTDGWFHSPCFYYVLIISISIIYNITVMFKFFYESILKYNRYAHFIISVDRLTDSAIRIFSLCLVMGEYARKEQYWVSYFTLAGVYLFEFTYVLSAFCLTKSEKKYMDIRDIDFEGKFSFIFVQAFILLQTEIAYHIPISGFPTRYPRLEAFLRHLISIVLVFWYAFVTEDVHRRTKMVVIFALMVLHYLSYALFRRILKPFKDVEIGQHLNQMGTRADRFFLVPVRETIRSYHQPLKIVNPDNNRNSKIEMLNLLTSTVIGTEL